MVDSKLMDGVHILQREPDGTKRWLAPNLGKYPVSHRETFLSNYSSMSGTYRDSDEALLDSRENARIMLSDLGILECIDARRRMVSLLDWHLQPENEKSHDQAEFCKMIENVIRRIKNFTEYRYAMQYSIWFGKYGLTHRWRADIVNNRSFWFPRGVHSDDDGWQPLHGDKIIFRQERPLSVPGAYVGQMGIRVGRAFKPGDRINNRWKVEGTDYGMAYFLSPEERRLMLVHKHHREDASYDDGIRAGGIHGVGIRSKIYREWLIKQETMAFLTEFIERMAGGIQIWKYPMGNTQALAEAKESAMNYNSGKEHIMLVPVPIGEDGSQYGVDIVEPGFQGIDTLHNLIKEYFNDRMKRFILGQKLSSEAEATGLGSGVAELHMDTLLQIIKCDAHMHEETLTDQLVHQIIRVNVMKKVIAEPGFRPRLVVETEEPDIEAKLNGVVTLIEKAGLKFRKKDLYDLSGMAMPQPGDEVNEDAPQQQGMPGDPNAMGQPGMPPNGPPGQNGEQPKEPATPKDFENGKDTRVRLKDQPANGAASKGTASTPSNGKVENSPNPKPEFVTRYSRDRSRKTLNGAVKPSGWNRRIMN